MGNKKSVRVLAEKETNPARVRVLMFPWLGYGHITPYFELAKKLSERNFEVFLCSSPANLCSIKHKIDEALAKSVHLVELHLPPMPGLPPQYHTTNGLPHSLMGVLKQALDESCPNFVAILEKIKPDLLIYDFLQPWAPEEASRLKIPAVEFITSSSVMTSLMFHYYKRPDTKFPYPSIYFRGYETDLKEDLLKCTKNPRERNLSAEAVDRSCKIVLIKGMREIEGKYIDYVSALVGKKFVPVGPLVQAPSYNDDENSEIIDWLDKKGKKSTVFVSFGSEYFLASKDLEEIAHGLELSQVNFIWVVRFPKGEEHELQDALPLGFLERVGERGLVVEGWAPQTRILRHENIGGFVSHCGWNSVIESLTYGVPIVALPMHIDQPINARLVQEIGVGIEVVRSKDKKLSRERIAKIIRRVVVEKGGESVRKKAVEMKDKIGSKSEQEIDQVVDEILEILN